MGIVAAAVAGSVVSGAISAKSAKDASKAADASAAQTSAEQALAIENAQILADEEEEKAQLERQRIFDATKPMQESASFTFGLQQRPEMGGFSDFVAVGEPISGNTGFNMLGGLS
ncbi:hypothetical protein DRJ25_06435 [Candidatus Woesearchaeota archaeon]|nr:MAG: hypothetical protein DRJ25_06435 [Candidatus Woesearchaeota archaeon]